jgi:hypothetical protein
MSVRTLWRSAVLTLIFSALLGAGLATAQQRAGEISGLLWETPGQTIGWINPSGDPDGVQGAPPPARKSGAGLSVTPAPGSPGKGASRAVWAHWLTGLLQRIGYRY